MSIKFKRIISLILVLTCLCTLSACRESPVLQQKVYVKGAEIDKDKQMTDNDEENDLEDEDLSSKKEKEDSKREEDYDRNIPQKGDEKQNEDSNDEANDIQEEQNKNDNQDEQKNENTEEKIDVTPTDDATEMRQIVDASGVEVEIPKDVNKVMALDIVAQYVEMLGGKNRVVATSESFKNGRLSRTVFGSSEIDNMKALWTKTGSSPTSDTKFTELISIKPDVCFVVSGQNTFTDAQLGKLAENKISVVTLPAFCTTDNIETAVHILADVLGDKSSENGQKDAHGMADRYISWLHNIQSSVIHKNHAFGGLEQYDFNYVGTRRAPNKVDDSLDTEGKYTVFVSGWNDSATYSACTDSTVLFGGTGMAITELGYGMDTPVSYYLSAGGACNTAAFLGDPMRKTVFHNYLSPLLPSAMEISDSSNWNASRNKNIFTATSGDSLGSSNFNKVVVASNEIKGKILADAASTNGLWRYYEASTIGGVTANFNTNNAGANVISSICNEYEIEVIPSGVGDWSDGSPEAALAMMWTNMVFYGDYSNSDLKSELRAFYSDFYSYNLTDANVSQIINGK